MIHSIELYSQRGRKENNEDSYVLKEESKLFGVFDGATSISQYINEKGYTGGYLASHILKSHFSELEGAVNLNEELIKANQKIKETMIKRQIDISNTDELWCSCAITVQVDSNSFRYAQVGDCMLIGIKRAGGYEILTTNDLEHIGVRLKEKRKKQRDSGVPLKDEEYYIDPLHSYQYMRTSANKEGGYSVANGDGNMKDFIEYGEREIKEFSSLILISDGLMYPSGAAKNHWEKFYHLIKTNGMKGYIDELSELESVFRLIDDKTAIVINFNEWVNLRK